MKGWVDDPIAPTYGISGPVMTHFSVDQETWWNRFSAELNGMLCTQTVNQKAEEVLDNVHMDKQWK